MPRLTNKGTPLTPDEIQAIKDDLGITEDIAELDLSLRAEISGLETEIQGELSNITTDIFDLGQSLDGKANDDFSNVDPEVGRSALGAANVIASPTIVTGADLTGATDCSAQVAAAFNAAANGNRWVHFPRGIYKFNYTLTNAMHTGHWRITGDGAGSTGDWVGAEPAGATLLKPNNNANAVFKFEFTRGTTISNLEIRGNGAGVSANGILIDNPAANFAGNGMYIHNVSLRGFTNGLNSIGGCNVVVRESMISNCNVCIKIPNLPLAHSYRFEQCSLGGLATYYGGSGTSRILEIADGSFVDLLGCEMGNCTDMVSMDTGAPVVNVIGGNMETISATVLNTMRGGIFNMSGVRIATGNKTVLRAYGTTAAIIGVNIENNLALGAMTLLEHHGIGYARLSGNGLGKLVTQYTDNTFTTVRASTTCERSVSIARLTATQSIGSATTATLICNVVNQNIGGNYDNTTGIFKAGKPGLYMVSAQARLDGGVVGSEAKLLIYIGSNPIATIDSKTAGGAGTSLTGSFVVYVAAGDEITVRIRTGGAVNIGTFDNYTTQVSFTEMPYFN